MSTETAALTSWLNSFNKPIEDQPDRIEPLAEGEETVSNVANVIEWDVKN